MLSILVPFVLPFSITSGMACTIYVYIGYRLGKSGYLDCGIGRHIVVALSGTVCWILAVIFHISPNCSKGFMGADVCTILLTLITSASASCGVLSMMYLYHTLPVTIGDLKFWGRNSILVMCIHSIEIRSFPWWMVWEAMDWSLGFKEQ